MNEGLSQRNKEWVDKKSEDGDEDNRLAEERAVLRLRLRWGWGKQKCEVTLVVAEKRVEGRCRASQQGRRVCRGWRQDQIAGALVLHPAPPLSTGLLSLSSSYESP